MALRQVPCRQRCEKDGLYTQVDYSNPVVPQLKCVQCPINSISIKEGFLFDGRLHSLNRLSPRFNRDFINFENECLTIDMSKHYKSVQESSSTKCQGWASSDSSIVAQHPHPFRSASFKEFVHFNLKYANDFTSESKNSVSFRFKAAQKQNDNFLNGLFEFKIDGKPMPIKTGVIFSDTWFDYSFDLQRGPHTLEWSYRKVNEQQVSEDLLAEIAFIEIRGVKQYNSQC